MLRHCSNTLTLTTCKLFDKSKIKQRVYSSPLVTKLPNKCFIKENQVIPKELENVHIKSKNDINFFQKAGPMKQIAYNVNDGVNDINVAIMNAGGLCPGINNVIYDLVYSLEKLYNVKKINGIQNGWSGFMKYNMVDLNIDQIEGIQHKSGSILGTSRNTLDIVKIFSAIVDHKINQLYVIGGDGTHKFAHKIHEYFQEYLPYYDLSIVCIPKTIDNDIPIIDKSFGFDTAVDEAKSAIMSAYYEAKDTENAIGIVKLMGRNSGWIANFASLASYNVDVCLIPEYGFNVSKLKKYVHSIMRKKGFCVIVVAEGVTIPEIPKNSDIGIYIKSLFQDEYCVKYIDPTYLIRALPANTSDSIYCKMLAQSAVHTMMNGYSDCSVGFINNKLCVIPLEEIVNDTSYVTKMMWFRLLESTLQPNLS